MDLKEVFKFIEESDISLTRCNGKYVNYYGPNGAAYVDVENKIIRTAFGKEQFDEKTRKLRDILDGED